jgi:SAM-dependent methyltransferase
VKERVVGVGRRFARFATRVVVAHPRLWRLFRRPIQAQFDWLAPDWEARRSADSLESLAAALDRAEREPRRILDLGTGTGLAARFLAERFPGAQVVGADLSPAMIAQADRLLPAELRARVAFRVADASALPFGDGEFDLVVLLNMIPFFDELTRVTAPGGSVVVASSSGPGTPIYVPPETLRERLMARGFFDVQELEAGAATAVLARKG